MKTKRPMREIKFRAWDKVNKKMFNVFGFTKLRVLPDIEGSEEVPMEFISLMEFTGLLDKNGKEIYEGDTLRYNYHIQSDSGESRDFKGVVEYHTKVLEIGYEHDETLFVGFILRGKDKGEDWFSTIPDIKDLEVIGNIWENGELLDL